MNSKLCSNLCKIHLSFQFTWDTWNEINYIYRHGRTGRKKLGGQKEICPTFRIVPDHFRKNFFRNKLISSTPPPSPKNFRSVYHFCGQKNFSGTINCQYCPTFKRILHDYLYLNNKLRAFWLFISHFLPDLCWIFARLSTL
jgi:hypothetical protein